MLIKLIDSMKTLVLFTIIIFFFSTCGFSNPKSITLDIYEELQKKYPDMDHPEITSHSSRLVYYSDSHNEINIPEFDELDKDLLLQISDMWSGGVNKEDFEYIFGYFSIAHEFCHFLQYEGVLPFPENNYQLEYDADRFAIHYLKEYDEEIFNKVISSFKDMHDELDKKYDFNGEDQFNKDYPEISLTDPAAYSFYHSVMVMEIYNEMIVEK